MIAHSLVCGVCEGPLRLVPTGRYGTMVCRECNAPYKTIDLDADPSPILEVPILMFPEKSVSFFREYWRRHRRRIPHPHLIAASAWCRCTNDDVLTFMTEVKKLKLQKDLAERMKRHMDETMARMFTIPTA